MALIKLFACRMVVLVLALTTATIDITGAAAAQECGACSQKCVADCRPLSSQNCEAFCQSVPQACDSCGEVVVWQRCAASCYLLNCLSGPDSAVQCPPQFTACSACDQTCDSPCDDLDQALCAGDCLLRPSSPECAACKDRAAKSCADTCRAIVCGIMLSCPPM